MFLTGLVSVTFRNKSAEEIIENVRDVNLDGIEWGGDIHAPSGNIETAELIAEKCINSNVKILSYGSYFRIGQNEQFQPVLDAALTLKTDHIRIWAGNKNGEETNAAEWLAMVEETRQIADILEKYNISLSFEYHDNTLTNTPESAVKLIEAVNKPNVFLYWQPDQYKGFEYNKNALKAILPYLSNVHVFNWSGSERNNLKNAFDEWREYINIIKNDDKFHNLLLEFVKDDLYENLKSDAETLHELLDDDVIHKINYYGLEIPYTKDLSVFKKTVYVKNDDITLKNPITVHPMEGFDGNTDGSPSELTERRYKRFASSGASLIWLEATAVQEDARSCSKQLWLNEKNVDQYKKLIENIRKIADIPLIIQLTHSGRYSKPNDKPEPVITYHNPVLNRTFHIPPEHPVVSDDYLDRLEDRFVTAAKLSKEAGFDGVDIKACHGYLIGELLSAYIREGKNGGSYENRTRLLKNIVSGTKAEAGKDFIVGSRFGIYDAIEYPYGFGVDINDHTKPDFTEPIKLLRELNVMGVNLIDVTMGTPYFDPNINKPSEKRAYLPPDHPLSGAERFIKYAGIVQKALPDMTFIGTGYTYLNKYSPYVAAAAINEGLIKCVGFGRMAFAYEGFANDMINGKFDGKKCCVMCGKCSEIMRAKGPTGCPVRDKYYTDIYKQFCQK